MSQKTCAACKPEIGLVVEGQYATCGARCGTSVHVTSSANECRASVRIPSGHYYNKFDYDKDLLYKQSDVRFRSVDFSVNVRQPGQ